MVGAGEDVAPNWDDAAPVRAPAKNFGNKRRNGSGAWSPRNCLLVRDFLVPCLDSGCYGDDLQWLNRRRGVFLIRWTHQGSKSFNREGPNVFRDWSILKRKWDERDPNRLSKAKQRVRAAFRKLPNVRRINDGAAPHRIYRIKDIGAYLNSWKEPKEKEKKRRKKQRPCTCVPGSPTCTHRMEQQAAASSPQADEDEDDDYMAEDYDEVSYDNKEVAMAAGSTPPSSSSCSPSSSGVWSSLLSLTETVSTTEEHEAPSSAASWGPADMEAVQALLSIRHGPHHRQPVTVPPPPPIEPTAPTVMGVKQDDQSVPTEHRAIANLTLSHEDEASLAPQSVHVFKEQLAAALALAPRPAQSSDAGMGDSPHMFWADAAPSRQGEQTTTVTNGGFVPAFGLKATVETQPSMAYEVGSSAVGGAVAMAAPQAEWTNHSSTSSAPLSWRDQNEPMRPDGCWSTR